MSSHEELLELPARMRNRIWQRQDGYDQHLAKARPPFGADAVSGDAAA
jgi:hypothetical protein